MSDSILEVLRVLRETSKRVKQGQKTMVAFRSSFLAVLPSNTSYATAIALYEKYGKDFDLAISGAKSID